MKLTSKERKLVKEFAQKIQSKKLNESANFNVEVFHDACSDFFDIINQYVGNQKISQRFPDIAEDIEATHTALSDLIGSLEDEI